MSQTQEPLQRPQPKSAGSPLDQAPKLEPGAELHATSIPIEKFEFTFPDRIRKPNDPKTVVLKELTEAEMETASKLGKGDNKRTGSEAVKMSLVSVDGRPVNHAEGEGDLYWGRWGMKVKFQLMEAWRRVNTTNEEDDKSFFDSMKAV